ncbi:MAG: hydroxyacylglutathione hydrolase [Deltaproteobacteria bacterium]|nr:hydroxyacylglutathione hydrolase [Deltaproteobacteria bacterium]
MEVVQFRYSSDNLGYLLVDGDRAVAVDGGAVRDIARYVEEKGISLVSAFHTHNHADHTAGTGRLCAETGARLMSRDQLVRAGIVMVGNSVVKVLETPGHTDDSLCFLAGSNLVSGDTLFNFTVGNCFSGDLDAFYRSVALLMALPPETVVWAGHDYVAASLTFARILTPANPHIDEMKAKYDPARVCSTIAEELLVNPYMRFNEPDMVELLEQKGLARETELERFKSVMELY